MNLKTWTLNFGDDLYLGLDLFVQYLCFGFFDTLWYFKISCEGLFYMTLWGRIHYILGVHNFFRFHLVLNRVLWNVVYCIHHGNIWKERNICAHLCLRFISRHLKMLMFNVHLSWSLQNKSYPLRHFFLGESSW